MGLTIFIVAKHVHVLKTNFKLLKIKIKFFKKEHKPFSYNIFWLEFSFHSAKSSQVHPVHFPSKSTLFLPLSQIGIYKIIIWIKEKIAMTKKTNKQEQGKTNMVGGKANKSTRNIHSPSNETSSAGIELH